MDMSSWDPADAVIAVVSGGSTLRAWVERDIPIGDVAERNNHVSALITRDNNTTVQVVAKRRSSTGPGVIIERIRFLETENVAS